MSAAREAILARIANTVGGAQPPASVPREYRRTGQRVPAERVALFFERVGEYRADVRRIAADEVAGAVAAVCRELGARRLAVPVELPAAWRPAEVELVEDTGLTPRELDTLDGVLTGSTLAIAETGTIVLTAGPWEGRRALTLVPDLHICIVRSDQIVEPVPEALELLDPHRPLTFISGPSATSDIELSRVEGVHGPRTLVVLLTSA